MKEQKKIEKEIWLTTEDFLPFYLKSNNLLEVMNKRRRYVRPPLTLLLILPPTEEEKKKLVFLPLTFVHFFLY
jgi:hypothetical protein